jgi:hypothetical protein
MFELIELAQAQLAAILSRGTDLNAQALGLVAFDTPEGDGEGLISQPRTTAT